MKGVGLNRCPLAISLLRGGKGGANRAAPHSEAHFELASVSGRSSGVEHNLAKVGVGRSNRLARSIFPTVTGLDTRPMGACAMFLVVFRNRKRADYDRHAYARDADAMEALAAKQPGYISFKNYASDDGEVIALSEWESEEAALAWRREVAHAKVQMRGRAEYYEDYTMFAGTPSRIHHFNQKDEA